MTSHQVDIQRHYFHVTPLICVFVMSVHGMLFRVEFLIKILELSEIYGPCQ